MILNAGPLELDLSLGSVGFQRNSGCKSSVLWEGAHLRSQWRFPPCPCMTCSTLILIMIYLHLLQKSTFGPFISGLLSLYIVKPCLLMPLETLFTMFTWTSLHCNYYLVITAVKLTSLMTVFECNHEVLPLI